MDEANRDRTQVLNELCQFKPAHGDGFFGEDGQRVPVCWPAGPEQSLSQRIIEALVESGIPAGAAKLAAPRVEALIEDQASERAVELAGIALARAVQSLNRTTAGVALQHALFGSEKTLRESAEETGTSHVALWKMIQTIRRKLGQVNRTGICREA